MKTEFALLVRFESTTVKLTDICEEFFGIAEKTAMQKSKGQDLPVPTFKLRNSQRSPTLVNIKDLAAFIDKQHALAKSDWDLIQEAKNGSTKRVTATV